MDNREKWKIAQIEERKQHDHNTVEFGLEAYRNGYRQYFEHLRVDHAQVIGKTIMEIGCADFPALYYITGYHKGIIVEPMPSDIMRKLISQKQVAIDIVTLPAEDYDFPKVDEVWLLNVLQHVIDPNVIINKAKAAASVIRFFEPIGTPLDKCHLHSFTLDYFRSHFGVDAVKHYVAEEGVKNFHTCNNAYGVWRKTDDKR